MLEQYMQMEEPEELEGPEEPEEPEEMADIVNLAGRIMDQLAQAVMEEMVAVQVLVVLGDLVCHLQMLMFMVVIYTVEVEIRDCQDKLEEAEEIEDLMEEDMLVELMA